MNTRAEASLIERIRQLPPERLAQVADFVEFLTAQEARRAAIQRFEQLRQKLPAQEITDTAMQEIVDLVREVRAEQRTKR